MMFDSKQVSCGSLRSQSNCEPNVIRLKSFGMESPRSLAAFMIPIARLASVTIHAVGRGAEQRAG